MSKCKSLKEEIFNFLDDNISQFENIERKEIIHFLIKKFNANDTTLSRYYSEWKKVYMLPREQKRVTFDIKKNIILNGKYARYLINENELKVGDLTFKSLQEIIDYENKEIAEFNMRMTELKAAIKYLGGIYE